MKARFYYPVKPYQITQKWGISRPEVYSQFGFTQHNGEDVALGADKLVRAPFDGTVVRKGYQPLGGGIFVGIISEPMVFNDGIEARVLLDALHMEAIHVPEGQIVRTGDVLGIADNTGFSTGPHTHLQFRRVQWDGAVITFVDKNQANDSFDPTPYWTGIYAADYGSLVSSYQTLLQKLQTIYATLKARSY